MSKYSIGISARGKKIKTYFETIKGKNLKEQEQSLKAALRQVQNIVYKRVNRLTAYEQKTGITSPALARLREAVPAEGVNLRGKDLDQLRQQYKALTYFLQDKTSTVKGLQAEVKGIVEDLKAAGYEMEGSTITGDEYQKFKALADKFYSESAKMLYYRQSGYMTQAELQETANSLISRVMEQGGTLEEMFSEANNILDSIAEEGFPEIEWIGTPSDQYGKMKL